MTKSRRKSSGSRKRSRKGVRKRSRKGVRKGSRKRVRKGVRKGSRKRVRKASRKGVRKASRRIARKRVSRLSKIKLEKGSLPGYKMDLPMKQRRKALEKVLKKNGYLPVMRKLNILSIFLRNTSPKKSAIAEKDKKWIMKNFKGKIPNETTAHKKHVALKKSRRE